MVGGTTTRNNAIVAGGTATAVYTHVIEGYTGEGVKEVRAMTCRAVLGCR